METVTHIDDRRAKRNVMVLVLAQAILGAQMPMIFTIGGLAGQSLSPNPCFATLSISLIVLGSMLGAVPISTIMQRRGRVTGFFVGAAGGTIGAAVSAYGLYLASFPIFLLGSLFTGLYLSAQGFFRFAAADSASDEFRPKAISYVMAGGLISAIIGPQLASYTFDSMVVPFLGTYLVVVALNVFGSILFLFLDMPKPVRVIATKTKQITGRTRRELLKDPVIIVAMIVAMVSYALMNLIMTSTPLAVVGCGYQESDAANVVTIHVLGMYIPAFFTGHLIARFGVYRIMGLGLFILASAGVVAFMGVELSNFYIALGLLGIGWNFGFIGATTLLASNHTEQERGRAQGLNDLFVFGCVTMASLTSGVLMNCSGSNALEGWHAVNIAMIPFLTLAGASIDMACLSSLGIESVTAISLQYANGISFLRTTGRVFSDCFRKEVDWRILQREICQVHENLKEPVSSGRDKHAPI